MSCGGEQGIGSYFQEVVGKTEMVWMPKGRRKEGGMPHRGRCSVEQCMARSFRKRSKKRG